MKSSPGISALFLLFAATLIAVPVWGQNSEVTTTEAPIIFQSGANLVPVSVVVRDNKGHAVGSLNIDDFQLFDNGKPQMISKFSVEKIVKDPDPAPAAAPKPVAAPNQGVSALKDADTDGIPERFIAYVFDDLHINLNDLAHTREAAKHQLETLLQPLSRIAVFTTSGHQTQEFTSDRARLYAALDAITASQAAVNKTLMETSCPPVDYYMADRIYNKHDLEAWRISTEDAMFCGPTGTSNVHVTTGQVSDCETSGSSDGVCRGVRDAKQAARGALLNGDRGTDASLDALLAVINRMAAIPGQRSIVLISPGFLVLDDRQDRENAIVNRAIKANVVIGGLDARGLASQLQGGDASDRSNSQTIQEKRPFQNLANLTQSDVVANLAAGTGGTFSQNTNDFDGALARVAAVPEYIYLLGFSPRDLKLDGSFHTLKVTLKTPRGMDLQVRKGYYAPRSSGDPASQAQQQIEEVFFSRNEVHDLPAVLQTQYFKSDDGDATLSAVAKIDVKKLAFHKEGNRNRNDITVITGLFDNDGNYISGAKKIVEMRLLDETLAKRAASGISVQNSFTVHPGRYVVRLVVRDSEGQTMSAQSSLVEIP